MCGNLEHRLDINGNADPIFVIELRQPDHVVIEPLNGGEYAIVISAEHAADAGITFDRDIFVPTSS